MSGMLYSIPVILTGYRIVQIEDEATPLAQAAKSGYYGDTVAGMLGIGVFITLGDLFYIMQKIPEKNHRIAGKCTSRLELVET